MPGCFRAAALVTAALVTAGASVGAPVATAEPREPSTPAPLPRWQRGLFLAPHAGGLGGVSAGGVGLDLELARGQGRWQVVGDALLAWTTVATHPDTEAAALTTTPPAEAGSASGFQGRLGLGVRRVVRAFEPDHSASIEMYVEGGAGLSRIWWNGGGTLTRPDLSLGAGWQVRALEDRAWVIRFGLRTFLHAPVDDAAGCDGDCPQTGQRGTDSGFLALIGAAW